MELKTLNGLDFHQLGFYHHAGRTLRTDVKFHYKKHKKQSYIFSIPEFVSYASDTLHMSVRVLL